MKMKTDELIADLTTGLEPVRRLASPAASTAVWGAAAAACLGAATAMTLLGVVPGGFSAAPDFLLEQTMALLTGGLAAFSAFASVIPGLRRRTTWLTALAASAWIGTLGWGSVRDFRLHGSFGLSSQTDWPCVVAMILGGGLMLAVIVPMLRGGLPMTPRVTALLGGAAALSVANVVACLAQPHLFTSVVLLWHGVTIALLLTGLVAASDSIVPRSRIRTGR
jgi:hypothetical protein